MQRQQSGGEVSYYFTMAAFKFPSSDDVYFSCSVDVCSECNFADICPSGRGKRDVNGSSVNGPLALPATAPVDQLQLHDFIQFQRLEDAMRMESFSFPESKPIKVSEWV